MLYSKNLAKLNYNGLTVFNFSTYTESYCIVTALLESIGQISMVNVTIL